MARRKGTQEGQGRDRRWEKLCVRGRDCTDILSRAGKIGCSHFGDNDHDLYNCSHFFEH